MSHKREKSIFSQEIVILKSRSGCFSKILFSLTCELAHETALTNTTYIFLKKRKRERGLPRSIYFYEAWVNELCTSYPFSRLFYESKRISPRGLE